MESGHAAVAKFELNPQLLDGEFDIPFPPKTRVSDFNAGNEVQFVIQANGEKGVVIPVRKNPKYQDLDKPCAAEMSLIPSTKRFLCRYRIRLRNHGQPGPTRLGQGLTVILV